MAVGKNITRKKGGGKQYHLPCNIKGCWEEYHVRKRGRGRKFRGRKSRFKKMREGKNIKL